MKGIVQKFDCSPFDFVEAREWAYDNFHRIAFTPEQVIAAAADDLEPEDYFDESGIYFLIRDGKICYIGKAKGVCTRVSQHRHARRPFDAVAAIVGIHHEFIGALEGAYVQAWEPPWNAAPVYCCFEPAEKLRSTLAAMDRSLICTLPELPPLTRAEMDGILEKFK